MNNPSNHAPPWPQSGPLPPPGQGMPNAPTVPDMPNAPKAPKAPKRMPSDEARRRAGLLKRWTLAGAALAFCGLTGLAASHLTGVTSAAGGSPGASATAAPSRQDDDGGFFPATNGQSNNGERNGSGFNFGSGSSFQPPVSSSGGS
ncbi:MAG: hypothetical protein ACM3N4_10025 [Nitrososphaerota archaeon]